MDLSVRLARIAVQAAPAQLPLQFCRRDQRNALDIPLLLSEDRGRRSPTGESSPVGPRTDLPPTGPLSGDWIAASGFDRTDIRMTPGQNRRPS